ncbi:MAG TPA: hypothetical protein VLS96_01605, partial [Nodosilinea sp.]|nr:hypothetical protein [Nodosilinea sp.]
MSRILAKKSGIQLRRQAPWLNKQALSAARRNKIVANLASRAVSAMLDGWKWGLSAQGIEHSKRPDIWRDRTLRRAFELMGGVPGIQLQP